MAAGAQHTHIDIEADARATLAHMCTHVNAERGLSVFCLEQPEATLCKGTRNWTEQNNAIAPFHRCAPCTAQDTKILL
jgi:hypothetical protein